MKCRKKKEPDYTFIAIEVDDYSVRAVAGINTNLLGSPHYIDNVEEPVHEFQTKLEITGLCTDPENRASHRFDIHMYGTSDTHRKIPMIKDNQKRDKDGVFLYRKLRG
ncbi:MAG: hypothetical protein AB2826_24880 [Candidatus Thiodiazotropha sp.]